MSGDDNRRIVAEGHAAIPEQVMGRLFQQIEAVLSATEPTMMLLQRERALGMLAAVALAAGVTTGDEQGFSFDLAAQTVGPPLNPEGSPPPMPNRATRRQKQKAAR